MVKSRRSYAQWMAVDREDPRLDWSRQEGMDQRGKRENGPPCDGFHNPDMQGCRIRNRHCVIYKCGVCRIRILYVPTVTATGASRKPTPLEQVRQPQTQSTGPKAASSSPPMASPKAASSSPPMASPRMGPKCSSSTGRGYPNTPTHLGASHELGCQEGGGGGYSLQDLHGHDVDLLKVRVEEQVEPDSSLTCGLCEETSTGRSVCCRKAAHESPGDGRG